MEDPCLAVPTAMPYATTPPTIWPTPLKLNQMLTRLPCSFFVYHWCWVRPVYAIGRSDIPEKSKEQTRV